MTTTIDAPRAATPWWHWLVVAIAVFWNGFGGYDYTMSHLQGETYYRQMGMSETVIALMESYPSWMHAVWAIGVWGSVLGSILLLVRSKWALHAFAASSLGAIGSLAYTAMTPAVAAAMGVVFPVIIVVICLVFIWYAWMMTKRGVLR